MRSSILVAGGVGALSLLLVAGQASAQGEGQAFGQKGELAVSWDQPLMAGTYAAVDPALNRQLALPSTLTPIGVQYFSVSGNNGSYTSFSLAPAADYFVVDNLSIGGQVLLGFVSSSPPGPGQGSTTTLYGIAPQIGYNIALSDSISFWPKVFFAFVGSSTSHNGGSASSGTLGVFAPFLFHIATHFYAGIGPDLSTQAFASYSNGNPAPGPAPTVPKVSTFGAMGTFGGWFDL